MAVLPALNRRADGTGRNTSSQTKRQVSVLDDHRHTERLRQLSDSHLYAKWRRVRFGFAIRADCGRCRGHTEQSRSTESAASILRGQGKPYQVEAHGGTCDFGDESCAQWTLDVIATATYSFTSHTSSKARVVKTFQWKGDHTSVCVKAAQRISLSHKPYTSPHM